jgi:hypothetical protein
MSQPLSLLTSLIAQKVELLLSVGRFLVGSRCPTLRNGQRRSQPVEFGFGCLDRQLCFLDVGGSLLDLDSRLLEILLGLGCSGSALRTA